MTIVQSNLNIFFFFALHILIYSLFQCTCISHAISKFNRRLFVSIFASIIVTKDDTKRYTLNILRHSHLFDEFIAFTHLNSRIYWQTKWIEKKKETKNVAYQCYQSKKQVNKTSRRNNKNLIYLYVCSITLWILEINEFPLRFWSKQMNSIERVRCRVIYNCNVTNIKWHIRKECTFCRNASLNRNCTSQKKKKK